MADPSPVTVRFAPSPTGNIHVGNARTALFNALFALSHRGRFILRFDDTDAERSRPAFAEAIAEDLAWLGIQPHAVYRQSERASAHAAAAERLKASGRLYPCFETAEELDRRRAVQRARGLPPVYDRAALKLTEAERQALVAAGRKPHWRFLLAGEGDGHREGWNDLVRGPQSVDIASLSDPVLVREDGTFLYTLPSVVDDIDLGITHVIRGDDHVTNTAVQIELFRALGGAVPVFGHHNLLIGTDGEPLSKRSGSQSVGGLRAAGYEAMAVASLAVLIGTSDAVHPAHSLPELAANFSLAHVSRTAARFDEAELDGVNARLLHGMPYAAVADRLQAMGVGGGEPFWLAVRGNCVRLADAARWWEIVRTAPEPSADAADADFLAEAAGLLPPEPWDGATWKAWTAAVKSASGRSGKALFMPLRRALTGLDHGPELAALLPFIGRSNTLARLIGSTSRH